MSIEHKTHRLSSRALAHLDGLLDEALEQTFSASDAVAIDIERESHDTEARVLESLHTARRQPEGGPADCTEALTRVHERSSAYSPRRCEATRSVVYWFRSDNDFELRRRRGPHFGQQ